MGQSKDLLHGIDCERIFLGWDAPLLQQAAVRFCEEIEARSGFGSGWVGVLPTAQSIHRFRELLSETVDTKGGVKGFPRLCTIGQIAELLYKPTAPIAIEFEQTLAWARALRHQSPERLKQLTPVVPEHDSVEDWLDLSGTLRRLANDLSAHDVDFGTVVRATETASEKGRWELLSELHARYLKELEIAGLSDLEHERRLAVVQNRVKADFSIALVGVADLNQSIYNVLAEVDAHVVSLIGAPPSHQSMFDALGQVISSAFAKHEIPLEDRHLLSAGDLPDQLGVLSSALSEFSAERSPGEIVVGTTDESHVLPTELELETRGLSSHRYIGWTVSETAVGRLIDLGVQLIARPTWRSLAALVRHADVHEWLSDPSDEQEDFLISIDKLIGNHFQDSLFDTLPELVAERYPVASGIRDRILELFADFLSASRTSEARRPISVWCTYLQKWLERIYSDQRCQFLQKSGRELTLSGFEKAKELLVRFGELNESLDENVSALTAFETLASRISELRVLRDQDSEDIQIVGWLDLALSDAPSMIVMGMNQPFVPDSVTSDPFLPGTLRAQLRIADNEQRYARDVYALQLILSTRRDVRLIVGKRSFDGSPTPPSRLLAASSADALPHRIQNLLSPDLRVQSQEEDKQTTREASQLSVPSIQADGQAVTALSVTAFKSYLECPYRFYLRHVLRLKPSDDLSRELAANQFGDLVHASVELFGESTSKSETDEKKIFEALRHYLDEYVVKQFGEHFERAVQLQVHQAESRLRYVAKEQAVRISDGWEIHATEASVDERSGARVNVGDRWIGLRGRFDRIDHHAETGRWAILDYKTHGHLPEKKHLRKNRETGKTEWIDLQLPLYRMMVPFLNLGAIPDQVQLGYFNISDKQEETRINIADFSPDLLDQADDLIHDCVRRILDGDFAPTNSPVQYDDYSMILQTGVASRLLAEVVESEGGASE